MPIEIVDVILPNYNKSFYINECLNSLTQQTYQNWRCIVVDGFSDDGSWEIIQEFARQDSRFELHQIARTGNLYQAWNFGLSKVINPYFCILTSDDIWEFQWLEIAIQSLIDCPSAICAAARTKIIDTNSQWKEITINNLMGERFFYTKDFQSQLRDGIISSIATYFLGPIYTSIHSLLLRKDILKQGEKFSEDLGSTADYEWYIKLGFYGDIIYHSKISAGWRFYEGQTTIPTNQEVNGNFMQQIHLRTREEIAKKIKDLEEEFKIIAEYYDANILAYHYERPCLDNLRSFSPYEILKLLKVTYKFPKEILIDILLKTQKKSFYVEESLRIAQRFLKELNKYYNEWKDIF
jgi:glycosyltransferase involved in cell wall biosynthesis